MLTSIPSSKTPLILLPGTMCDKAVWQHQLTYLQDIADFFIPDLSTPDSPEAMVEAVLNIAPAQFALAGHSMGGWVAIEVAKRVPERILKLCIIDTTAENDTPEKKLSRQKKISLAKQGQIETIIDELTELFTYHPNVRTEVKNMFLRNKNAFIHQQAAIMNRENSLPALSKITCPTLLIHARLDKPYPVNCSEKMLSNLPNAKLAIIENSGHMVTMEMPEAVTALMRYWLLYF